MTANTADIIQLLPLAPIDAPKLVLIANNEKIAVNMRDIFPYPYTLTDAENFIQKRLQDAVQSIFGIFYNTELAGIISLNIQQDVYRHSAELGYFVGEKYWNKGIATKSVAIIVKYGFESLHLKRIFAGVFGFNKASMRVLEKNNFVLEGIKRKAILKNNSLYDEYFYAIVNE